MKKHLIYILLILMYNLVFAQCDISISSLNVQDATCYGFSDASVELFVSGGTSPYTYTWENGLPSSAIVTNIPANDYSLTISDGGGCDTVFIITVSEPDLLVINSTITNSLCAASNGAIDVQVVGGVMPYAYLWEGLTASANVSELPTGIYTLNVYDFNNCSSSFKDTVISNPKFAFAYSKTDHICKKLGSVSFDVEGGLSPFVFRLNNTLIEDNFVSELEKDDYVLEVEDANQCYDSVHFSVTRSFCTAPIPSEAFTPNGDGINDTWEILNIEQHPDASLTIYDRWGQVVFEKVSESDLPWNGNFNGKELPATTYYYVLKAGANNEGNGVITGAVAIVR